MLVEKYHAANKRFVEAILPPVRRFGGGRAAKKRSVIEKLKAFFEKFMGLVGE